MSHIINFEHMEWIAPAEGVRYKAFRHGKQQMRLVEFSHGFTEPDWCRCGHAGYVLDGEMTTDFSGTLERHKKGDAIFIPAGEDDRHMVVLAPGERVTLLLFELVD